MEYEAYGYAGWFTAVLSGEIHVNQTLNIQNKNKNIKDTRLPARVEYEANGNAGWFTALPIGYKTFTFKIEGNYEKYAKYFREQNYYKKNYYYN